MRDERSWWRRVSSFLERLANDESPSRAPAAPGRTTGERSRQARAVEELRSALTPEEQTLLVLRVDRELSWREVAEIMAVDGRPQPEEELRRRFDRIKEKARRAAAGRGFDLSALGTEPFSQLAVAEVARLVGDPGAHLFDVRSRDAWARGHLPGASWTSLDDVVKNLPAGKTLHLVYYGEDRRDGACHDAARAAWGAGYRMVFVMPAGLDGWREAGKRVEVESAG